MVKWGESREVEDAVGLAAGKKSKALGAGGSSPGNLSPGSVSGRRDYSIRSQSKAAAKIGRASCRERV